MSSTNAKKPKPSPTLSPTSQIDILRNHILACPDIPSHSPILQSLLTTLDKEAQKITRDEKLRQKFSQKKPSSTPSSTTQPQPRDDDIVAIPPLENDTTNNDEDMEWQDVVTPPQRDSPLGKKLSTVAISSISKNKTLVRTPLAALTAAIHSALLHLGFRCTGIPPSKNDGGFAPPIREIKTFLPPRWDGGALRYRKDGVGAVVLRVTEKKEEGSNSSSSVVVITFGATGDTPRLELETASHVNRESLDAALSGAFGGGVAPALHYKNLAGLMTEFATVFDLGSVEEKEGDDEDEGDESRGERLRRYTAEPVARPYCEQPPRYDSNPHRIPLVSDFAPARPRRGGDFAGDLRPGGGLVDPLHAGSLMGPNHPGFFRGEDGPNLNDGGLGMRPRFDPYGPPGGPMDIGRGGRGRGSRRGASGNPNPDHLRPPSMGGDDMFM